MLTVCDITGKERFKFERNSEAIAPVIITWFRNFKIKKWVKSSKQFIGESRLPDAMRYCTLQDDKATHAWIEALRKRPDRRQLLMEYILAPEQIVIKIKECGTSWAVLDDGME